MRRSLAALCSLLAALFLTSEGRAQVNTDSLRPGPARPGLGGGVDASFTMLAGNVNLLDLGIGGRIQATSFFPPRSEDAPDVPPYVRELVLLMGNAHYTARDGNAFLNQGLLHARYMHMWHRRIGSNVFAQHQFNEFQRLRLRSLWGTSVSLQIIHERVFNLSAGSGYMLELNRIAVLPGAPDLEETLEHRWSNFLGATLTALDGRLLGQSTTYFQPRFDELSDLRLLEEVEIVVKASDLLSFGGVFSVLVDTAPPTGVQATDTRIASNVKLSF